MGICNFITCWVVMLPSDFFNTAGDGDHNPDPCISIFRIKICSHQSVLMEHYQLCVHSAEEKYEIISITVDHLLGLLVTFQSDQSLAAECVDRSVRSPFYLCQVVVSQGWVDYIKVL